MATVTEELKFLFCFILTGLNFTSHGWLVTTSLDSEAVESKHKACGR